MALLGGIAAVLIGTALVLTFFYCWGEGLRRYGRRADALALSTIIVFVALVAYVLLASPPF